MYSISSRSLSTGEEPPLRTGTKEDDLFPTRHLSFVPYEGGAVDGVSLHFRRTRGRFYPKGVGNFPFVRSPSKSSTLVGLVFDEGRHRFVWSRGEGYRDHVNDGLPSPYISEVHFVDKSQ